MHRPKFLILLFPPVTRSSYKYLRYRHSLDSVAFRVLEGSYTLKYLKTNESGFKPEGYDSNEIYFPALNKFFFLPLKMCLFIRKEQPDIIFLHGFGFPVQLLCLRFFLPRHTKVLVQHHAEKPFLNRLKLWLQRKAYSSADAYLFASKELSSQYIKQGIIKDAAKIYEVMEVSCAFKCSDKLEARRRLGLGPGMVFLWVGRLDENKDPLCVLQALKMLKSSNPDFIFYMIYGTKELEREVETFIYSNSLNENVKLIGELPHKDLESWFNAADLYISTSHYEGSGIALCEAMSCGCVPVATNIPSFRFMTDYGECAYLFEPGNSEQLYNILKNLNTTELKQRSGKARLKFEKDLSYEAIGKNILAICQRIK